MSDPIFERLIIDAGAGRYGLGTIEGWPVSGHVTSLFGAIRNGRPHTGVDIAGATPGAIQGAPVYAPSAGVVLDAFHLAIKSAAQWIADWKAVYGNSLIVQHGAYVCLYAHLDSIAVQEGQAVTAGQVIGRVGNTGQSTGPHLHWGMAPAANRYLQSGHAAGLLDPLAFAGRRPAALPDADRALLISSLEMMRSDQELIRNTAAATIQRLDGAITRLRK